MDEGFSRRLLAALGGEGLTEVETLQRLWSGYGRIVRYGVVGGETETVIVKQVDVGGGGAHPRGWNTDLSHARKLRSYEVETCWYRDWSGRCGDACRVPRCYLAESAPGVTLMALEDLDAAGFGDRCDNPGMTEMAACLRWLAAFHATFLGEIPTGLWHEGTYWHLATRPDELAAMDDPRLREAAPAIDARLRNAHYQTLVHGDAKLANFCFSADGDRVAAVDFQYVGGGCGMKDIAYFISSCLRENECERLETKLLTMYFDALRQALKTQGRGAEADAVEAEWRCLYPYAWTDFFRFLQGWSPGHWKIHRYSQRLARETLADLGTASP